VRLLKSTSAKIWSKKIFAVLKNSTCIKVAHRFWLENAISHLKKMAVISTGWGNKGHPLRVIRDNPQGNIAHP
jgi:hypothetical protein